MDGNAVSAARSPSPESRSVQTACAPSAETSWIDCNPEEESTSTNKFRTTCFGLFSAAGLRIQPLRRVTL